MPTLEAQNYTNLIALTEETIIHGYLPLESELTFTSLQSALESTFTQLPEVAVPPVVVHMYTELERAQQKTLFVDWIGRNNTYWQKYVTL